jgi:fructose-1,6-bisphosphatase II / sedoheptulose-1,7-bisphosphatase
MPNTPAVSTMKTGPVAAGRIDRSMSLEIARVTEQAAIAAARLRGRGDEEAADQAAVDSMRRELNRLPIKGRVVIGEGERDEAPMLYIGETLGTGEGPEVDIAVDPVEGTTLCAKNMPDCLAVLAIAAGGTMLHAPDIYMNKLAIGPDYAEGTVDLDATPGDNLSSLAKAKGVAISDLTACILDRPRHLALIEAVRKAGAMVRLIGDGDVAGVMQTTNPESTGVDIYFGIGGAPEGVLAAAALRCIGGQMQARLHPLKDEDARRAEALGIPDITRRYSLLDLVGGDVFFAATGVTDGAMLRGVRYLRGAIETETVVMRSYSKTVRWIRARHGRPG